MSKAKELAREWIKHYNNDWEDQQYKGSFLIAFAKSFFGEVLEGKYDTVLSEPEPELKGWIEVGEKPNRKLINLNTGKIFEETKDNRVLFENCREDGYERIKISFDDFKQLIARAS